MNWILKNKKIICRIKSFFGSGRIKNISQSKKTKMLFIGLVLLCIFIPQISFAATSGTTNPSRYFNPLNLAADATVGVLLTGVQAVMIFLMGIATSIFGTIVDPANISGSTGLLEQSAIKDVWIMVRDTLNMFFILILLFSAFCTIFQVEKWNLKKLWLSILINALLVNFSFPIARFFIDISNVAMYYFINHIFGTAITSGANIFATFSAKSEISAILFPGTFISQPFGYEIAIIIFTFILAITLLVIAILFAVRLAALAILVMFSPLGFVGYIFPSTSSFADRWWKELFSYAFFGPIMIFVLAIALKILEAAGNLKTSALSIAQVQTKDASEATFIASAVMFSIPIILLWMGMGLGKSMGIAGANAVVGAAQKAAKWVGMKASGATFVRDTYKSYRSRREQAKGDKWANRLGNWAGNKQDQLHGVIAPNSYGGQHATNRYQSAESARVYEEAKLRDTANMKEGDLRNLSQSGDKFAKAAAMLELAARGRTNGTQELDKVKDLFGENSQVFKQMQNRVKTYDPSAAFIRTVTKPDGSKVQELDETAVGEYVQSNQFDAKKLNASSLKDDKFLSIAMKKGSIKSEDLNDLAKKSEDHSKNIKESIKKIAGDPAHQNTIGDGNEANRQIHLAHVAATGKFSDSLTDNGRKEIIKHLNKDNTANIKFDKMPPLHVEEIVKHVNTGKFSEIASNLKSDESKQALVNAVKSLKDPVRQAILLGQVKRSPILAGFK